MIYKGDVRMLYVKKLEVTPNGITTAIEDVVIKKDSLFYKNICGKMINFSHDTFLPTYDEAYDYVSANKTTNVKKASCIYADYKTIHEAPEEKRSVKELKKIYKSNKKI